MCFQIHENRAIATSFCPSKIINPNHSWSTLGVHNLTRETAKQRRATGSEPHLCDEMCGSLTTGNGCDTAQELGHRLSSTLVAFSKHGEIFSKRLAWAGRIGTAKAPCLDQQDHCLT